jgi:Transposase DDE domain
LDGSPRLYPIRAMVGLALVKSVYALPTWTRAVRLVAEHAALRETLGAAPSVDAAYRFSTKLREHGDLLTACLDRVLASLRDALPGMGETVAIDGSDMPAYANGQRYVSRGGRERERFSDPDASWGHRSSISTRSGGGYYGFKLHAAVCTTTGLPVAWQVETARVSEQTIVAPLLDALAGRGIVPQHVVMDRGYDTPKLYDECESRGIRPVISLRETAAVKAGKAAPPKCDHGVWTFAGADTKRAASKWRCPTGECKPASVWLAADRLHPLIPRGTDRFKALYHKRGAVEREFGRLMHECGLGPARPPRWPARIPHLTHNGGPRSSAGDGASPSLHGEAYEGCDCASDPNRLPAVEDRGQNRHRKHRYDPAEDETRDLRETRAS